VELYMLAFDHRGSFERMVGDVTRIPGAKRLIWEGFLRAVDEGVPSEHAGILVDAQYGPGVARAARERGHTLAMPVEKSGRDEFVFEYGDRFGEKIEEFDPDFAKVLVRLNPEGDAALNARQVERLRLLSEWLHARHRRFLFELLVPATPEQRDRVGGDARRYDRELRPGLMLRAIRRLQDAGVEPDIWKVEGLDDRRACEDVVRTARRDGRGHASCIVLGRNAADAQVDEWLGVAARVRGYAGFAIGRSIFAAPVAAYAADPDGFDRRAAVEAIARRYRRFIDVYERAAAVTTAAASPSRASSGPPR
jgi:myo-inositol catabolism protein IolC